MFTLFPDPAAITAAATDAAWDALPLRTPLPQPPHLPMSRAEMDELGWDELDVLLVSGDAYVDHPSFGVPLLGRLLVAHGFRTGLVTQPREAASLTVMGRPRLFAGVSAGAIDSMLAHHTAFRKPRRDDAYTPGGRAGRRPDRAVTVYANFVRRAFPGLWVLAGGIEASLRRAAHYDFWSDRLRPSLVLEAGLDLIIYGMGERALVEAARRTDALADSIGPDSAWWPPVAEIWGPIAGTAHATSSPALSDTPHCLALPSWSELCARPDALLEASLTMEREAHLGQRTLTQLHEAHGAAGEARTVIIRPPAQRLSTREMDALYDLPFSRRAHPAYAEPIPAAAMICSSITTHRGCGGGCSFCSLALHQGRRMASRSEASVLREAEQLGADPTFNGSISDVGGPSANMWGTTCRLETQHGDCRRASCLFPEICRFFEARQGGCVDLLRTVEAVPGVRHVRVASGVRFDLALKDPKALAAYAGEFTGGQLKIAPEHAAPEVLRLMRKPGLAVFDAFLQAFADYSRRAGKEQYVVPYLMSAFPGCTDDHMRELAAWLKARHWSPRQVQCFIPTPGTVATAMFWSGRAADGQPLYVARSDAARRRQHDILLGDRGHGPAGRKPAGPRAGKPAKRP